MVAGLLLHEMRAMKVDADAAIEAFGKNDHVKKSGSNENYLSRSSV